MPQTPHIERHFMASDVVRDIVIGMADGLTVPFALAAGLTGAIDHNAIIITAGLAEIAAGSIAMGLGGYLAAKSDAEHYAAEERREHQEVKEIPREEMKEVADIFREYGIDEEHVGALVEAMATLKRALVIDDDDPIRTMLSKIIERHDFDVETAKDGAEAIDRIAEDGYDVILLDLMMPRVDGYSVLEYMHEHKPELLERTIVASAVPRGEVLSRFPKLACRVHMKPFDVTALLNDVRDCAA